MTVQEGNFYVGFRLLGIIFSTRAENLNIRYIEMELSHSFDDISHRTIERY